ncbi:NAD(P)/FAD-dependent oxidoreductase [Stackebrandtia albiflava]
MVGLGVGGEEVAGRLAGAGLDVVGVEGKLVGGECPYWACIPSKMMIRAADLLAETARVDGMAGRAHAIPDWTPVARRIRDEATDNWDDTVAVKRFTDKGGRFVRGWATLTSPNEVTVGDQVYRARRGVVFGTGSAPVIPPIDGLADTPYWTNRELVEADTLPDSLLVLGGGAIGLELAQAWNRFGVEVNVIEASDRIMSNEEPESSALVQDVLAADGVHVHTGAKATAVSHGEGRFTVTIEDGRRLIGEALLVSVGRKAKLGPLGVDKAGLDPSASSIPVDEWMRAGDGLWAVGDVTGRGAFTHVAMYQADIAVRDILGQGGPSADYRALPRVTFTDPEVGSVGMTEAQAHAADIRVRTGTARVPETSRGWIHKAGNAGLIKLVADADAGVLVGATSVGPCGGEVLSMLTLAVKAKVPIDTLRDMIYAYPTFHRGVLDAVHDLDAD